MADFHELHDVTLHVILLVIRLVLGGAEDDASAVYRNQFELHALAVVVIPSCADAGPDRQVLVSSVASWRPFPDAVDALQALGSRYRLAIISNIDDDLFAITARQLGVEFDLVVTAQQVQCYKPHSAIFEEALRRLAIEPRYIAHVAEGVTEIPPARRLGCTTIWVRRYGRSAPLLTEAPDLEVPDLNSMLVPMGADD